MTYIDLPQDIKELPSKRNTYNKNKKELIEIISKYIRQNDSEDKREIVYAYSLNKYGRELYKDLLQLFKENNYKVSTKKELMIGVDVILITIRW